MPKTLKNNLEVISTSIKKPAAQFKKIARIIAPGAYFVVGFIYRGLPVAWAAVGTKFKRNASCIRETTAQMSNSFTAPMPYRIIDYRFTLREWMVQAAQKAAWEKLTKERAAAHFLMEAAAKKQTAILEKWMPTLAVSHHIQQVNQKELVNLWTTVNIKQKLAPQPKLLDVLELAPHKKWSQQMLTESRLKETANKFALDTAARKFEKITLKGHIKILVDEFCQLMIKSFEVAKLRGGKLTREMIARCIRELQDLKEFFEEFFNELLFLLSELIAEMLNFLLKLRGLLFPKNKRFFKAFFKSATTFINLLKSGLRIYMRYINAGIRNKRYVYESTEVILAFVLWCYILNFVRTLTDNGTFKRYKRFNELPSWLKNILYFIFGVFRTRKLSNVSEVQDKTQTRYFYIKQMLGYMYGGILFKLFLLTFKFLITDNADIEKQALVMERITSGLPPYSTLDPDIWFPLI